MALRSATGGTILMSTHKQETVNTVSVAEHYFMLRGGIGEEVPSVSGKLL